MKNKNSQSEKEYLKVTNLPLSAMIETRVDINYTLEMQHATLNIQY